MNESIKNNEINWHRENVAAIYKPDIIPEDSIELYRDNPHAWFISKQFMFKSMGNLTGMTVLDIGSGTGINAVQMAKLGAVVRGFDITPELVELSNRLAYLNQVEKTCNFEVGEVTAFPFEIHKYDIILIDNVLHHIPVEDWHDVLRRIRCAGKNNGMIIIREPVELTKLLPRLKKLLGHNPEASPDEHELNAGDIRVIRSYMFRSKIRYFNLLGRLATFPIPNIAKRILLRIDRLLFLIPGMKRLAAYVVIVQN